MKPIARRRTHRPTAALIAVLIALVSLLASFSAAAQPDTSLSAVWRATSRLGYGPTAATAQAAQTGAKAWGLQQIDAAYAASQQAPLVPAELARFNQTLEDTMRDVIAEREARKQVKELATVTNLPNQPNLANPPGMANNTAMAGPADFSRQMQQTAAAWRLMSCSDPSLENPLLARMTEFWFNHLNVFVGKGTVRTFVGHYVVNVSRANALGKFEDLLLVSARHPAMLLYLDQSQSKACSLNENYARELMELHTQGVDAGYS